MSLFSLLYAGGCVLLAPEEPPPAGRDGDTGEAAETGDEGDTAPLDGDGDGVPDDADMLEAVEGRLCIAATLIDWTGPAYLVGYGFGTDSDWGDTSHPMSEEGDARCWSFEEDGLYRVNAWNGETGSGEAWARVDAYCAVTPGDPLCWANTTEQQGGWAICLALLDEEVSGADCTST